MILGLGQSKYNINGVDVLLDHSIMDPVFSDPDMLEKKSIITGKRRWKSNDYAQFDVIVFLSKYGVLANIMLNTFKTHEGMDVIFYPHRDGSPVRNEFNEIVLFTFIKVEPFHLNDDDNYDACRLVFKATDKIYLGAPLNVLGYGFQYGYNYGYGL